MATRGAELLHAGARFGSRPGLFSRLLAPGFRRLLQRIDAGLATGQINGVLPDGSRIVLGGRAPGFTGEIHLKDWRGLLRLATGGSAGWYQAWEAGEWTSPDPVPLFALFAVNGTTLGEIGRAKGPWRWGARLFHWLNRNTKAQAERNIHAHYDLGNDFYRAWLDPTMSYSSAIFEDWGEPNRSQQMLEPLAYAQLAKITTMLNRVHCHEAGSLLEIGCGWGALAYAASVKGQVKVDAISLSDEQLTYARAKGKAGNLKPNFLKRDYREMNGQYDAIVSVEMVEALGREYWPDFMDCVARNLKPGGRAAIQFIAMQEDLFEGYARNADFIQAYIFPGGMLIKTSEFRALAEVRGLRWTDQTDFGLHYAETLRLWRERFDAAEREGRLPAGFDARFCRLWRYYLQYCEGGFRGGGITVSQVTLVKGG